MKIGWLLRRRINRHSTAGNALMEARRFVDAEKEFHAALALVPDPKGNFAESTWIYTAIGDACFLDRRFDAALDAFCSAIDGPDGLGNPFIHLRLGQTLLELGHEKDATDNLAR